MQDSILHSDDYASINERLNKIYDDYLNVICPFIATFEKIDNNFPVPILNEIRALSTHIARINLSDDGKGIEENITKAERHIKRAILDCYKFLCMAYDDYYSSFELLYKNVDLSVIDNGEFLPKLMKLRKKASLSIKQAQICEALENCTENELFERYEDAYNQYAEVYNYIEDSIVNLEKAKHRVAKKDIFSIAGFVVGALGLIVGVIGIVL